MAQQGGPYQVPRQTYIARSLTRSSVDNKTDSQETLIEKDQSGSVVAAETDEAQTDGQPWVVVTNPEVDKVTESADPGFTSNFNLKVGLGKWKFTVFSWDIDVRFTR